MLGQTREECEQAQLRLEKSKQNLREYEHDLESSQKECKSVTAAKDALLAEAKELQKRLAMAQRMLTAIDEDQRLWKNEINDMKERKAKLLGSALLSSSFVSYMGPLVPRLRKDFVEEFLHGMASSFIECGQAPDALALLCDSQVCSIMIRTASSCGGLHPSGSRQSEVESSSLKQTVLAGETAVELARAATRQDGHRKCRDFVSVCLHPSRDRP